MSLNYLSKKSLQFQAKEKIALGFLLIIIAVIITFTTAYISIVRINNVNRNMLHLDEGMFAVGTFRADFNQSRSLSISLLIENDQQIIANRIKELMQNQAILLEKLNEITFQMADWPNISTRLSENLELLRQYIESRKKFNNLISRGLTEDAANYLDESLTPMYINISDKLLLSEEIMLQEKAKLSELNRTLRTRIIKTAAVMGSILFILVIVVFVYLSRMLKIISKEIKDGIEVLANSSQNILSTITEMSTGASETAASVSETTATVEEVRQTAMVSNKRAQSLLENTNRAKSSAVQGHESLLEVITIMDGIDQQMRNINDTVQKLSEDNRRISEITTFVSEIADQTNLLAVNAAIEASKAGEQGKGFSVVAQEMRTLSDQSKRAMRQVKEILHGVEQSVHDTVGVAQGSKSIVELGKQKVKESGEVISILAEHTEESADSAMQISSSSHQQMAGMDQIVPAMENIKQASEHNAEGIRQAQKATKELHSLGLSLKSIIQKYNL